MLDIKKKPASDDSKEMEIREDGGKKEKGRKEETTRDDVSHLWRS